MTRPPRRAAQADSGVVRPTRRQFLGLAAGGVLGAACGVGGDDAAPLDTTTTSLPTTTTTQPPVGPDPFTLGVASGDPDHRSVALWTFVDRPPAGPLDLRWEVAADRDFGAVVRSGRATASPDHGMTVHLVADGLEADTAYWYRFELDGHRTIAARTRTAPAPGELPADPVRVGQLSCQKYSSGYWTALDDLTDLAPDVVVHCGDYIYESHRGGVRPVDLPVPEDLDGYRAVWRHYKSQPELQAAHAVAPWLVVWDDHEVENDYQGTDPSAGGDPASFVDRRAAAYRAWWEFTPTRLDPPDGSSLRIHRQVDWGALTRFVLLDTRQYRDDQPCGGVDEDLGARCDATSELTMLGAEQEAWLGEVLDHDATWTTVVQQVVVHQWRILPGNTLWNLDQWDGYTGARQRLLDALGRSPDPVVLTGDVHSSWVADLPSAFDSDDASAVGVEFVTPGVSSAVPDDLEGRGTVIELQSPHVVWQETERRGWVVHTVTADEWTAEYRLVDDATVPDSAVEVANRFTLEAGRRRLS